MSDSIPAADEEPPAQAWTEYMYKPSLMGAYWQFALRDEDLSWNYGRYAGVLRYDRIKRVRLSFRPVTMQMYRFIAEIWSDDAPKITVSSASWRSVTEQTRQDGPYRDFILELHRRMAAAGSRAEFITGLPPLMYWVGVAIYAAGVLGLAALTLRALQAGDWAGGGLVGAFLVLFGWQVGRHFQRNRPGRYSPDDVPHAALPKAPSRPKASA